MPASSQLQQLTRYKQWADTVFFNTVSELTLEQLQASQKNNFGSLIRTLHHSYAMDDVWKAHLLGVNHHYTSRNPEQCPDLAALNWQQLEIDQWFYDYAAELNPENEHDLCRFQFIDGSEGSMTKSDILIHVVNHCTYHRGHVAAMLYQFGVYPPTTDYPVFIREQRRNNANFLLSHS